MQRIRPDQAWALYDVAATRQLEQSAAAGLPPHTLMRRAGLAVARLALALAPHARRIWIACGPGNNGGDGLEAAMHLQQRGGRPVVSWLGDESRLPDDARASLARARAAGVTFVPGPPQGLTPQDLVIDALLGLGGTRAPQGRLANWLSALLAAPCTRLAVDLPTGLDADTGVNAIKQIAPDDQPVLGSASLGSVHTLSLLTLKPGLFTADGRDAAGTVWFDDLGVDASGHAPSAHLIAPPPPQERPHAAHKGRFGDVAVLGGEGLATRGLGMTGAALLAGSAALHGGAGRVLVALLDGHGLGVDPAQPELMLRRPEALDFAATCLVCGCGGGQALRPWLPQALARSPRLVLDADGLNAIASDPDLARRVAARADQGRATVLTPHPLEAARLLGARTAEVQADRLAAARTLAEQLRCTVALKGSGTVVCAPGHTCAINPTGNGRLATAGTGDVLAGLIGAHLAAGVPAFEAACAAVWTHGALADAWPAGQALTAGALARRLMPPGSPVRA